MCVPIDLEARARGPPQAAALEHCISKSCCDKGRVPRALDSNLKADLEFTAIKSGFMITTIKSGFMHVHLLTEALKLRQ